MSQLKPRARHLPALGGLIGIAGLLGILRLRRAPRRRWPSADRLMKLSEADFHAFIQSTGIKTVTSVGLVDSEARAD